MPAYRASIVDALTPLATSIDNLTPDPDNARRGDVSAIRRSLNVFGQRKPVVVKRTGTDADGNPTGVIIAGNHTYLAARDLNWSHVAAVFVEDDANTAKAYALADNRTGELATWDDDQLAETLRELTEAAADFDLDALGWTEAERMKLMGVADFAPDDVEPPRLDQRSPHMCPQCGFEWRVGPGGEVEPV